MPCAWRGNGRRRPDNPGSQHRVLIYGAGNTGALAYRFLMAEKEPGYKVVGFLDDDPAKRHRTLHRKKVLGDRFNIDAVVKLYQIHEIFLAMPYVTPHDLYKIIQACHSVGVRYRFFPIPHDREFPGLCHTRREMPLKPLFTTPTIDCNQSAVRTVLEGKCVLLAGASGAFGLELCQQILRVSPRKS